MTEVIQNKGLYDKDQLEQLRLGAEHGVDISVYENPKFMALQMEWIRLGLEQNIDVSIYARPEFDWFQMEEIYKGIVGSVDVSKYYFSSVPYDRMREIRKGLEQGVDLSPFGMYGSKELKQLRHALRNNVNIVNYIVEGYEAEQLEVIRKAIAAGIKIEPYLSKEYRGIALEEIVLGLEKNLDVDVYAKTSYSWQQMREIREGLEERLDVSLYSSDMYNASQMHEIRLGLEMGLDVTSYRSLMYTAKDMQKMRIKLVEEITGGSSIPMVPGDDGYHEYLFDREKTGALIYLKDGSVDFKRSYQYAPCKPNEVIAIYHEATEGKNGISKNGKVIKAVKGKEKKILSGKGVYYDAKFKTYKASVSGWIHLDEENDLLEIKPAVIMDSVVAAKDYVMMSGNVEVMGNIEAGSRIDVDGDLIVNGHVEEAKINCSGNVVIRGGINGNRNAVVSAGKSLICMYVENCVVYSTKDVRTNYILSSTVKAKGEVVVAGSKGSIIGATIQAEKGIACEKAGNDMKAKTELAIVFSAEVDAVEKKLKEKRQKILKELEVLNLAKEQFKAKFSAELRNTNTDFIKIENAIYTKNLEFDRINSNIRIIIKQKEFDRRAKITVVDKMYEGVVFRIDNAKFDSYETNGPVIIENSNGKISVTKE